VYILVAFAVVVDFGVVDVISAFGVAWAPALVMVSAVSGVAADAVVLTAVDVPLNPCFG
jgi:hypothetical protein